MEILSSLPTSSVLIRRENEVGERNPEATGTDEEVTVQIPLLRTTSPVSSQPKAAD